MKKRCAFFDIDNVFIGHKYSDFDISFDVSYLGNAIVPLSARFSIDNLSQSTMNYIATNTMLFSDRTRHIKFYCGYEDNVRVLFDGEISKARPTGQPDTSLIIDAWTSTKTMGTNISIKRKNITYIDLVKEAAERCRLSCNILPGAYKSAHMQQIVDNFSHTGSEQDFLARVMNDITGFNFVEGQILFCIGNGRLTVGQSDEINSGIPVREISSNTGLIGIPEITAAGVNLRTLLDVTLFPGQTIMLKSKLMPLYNGLYNIYGINYHGSLRGDDFYSDLVCSRVYKQGEYGVAL